MFESYFFKLLKHFLQLICYYKYINKFHIHNSFKLKKKLFHFKIFTSIIIFLNDDFITMCKYINFNNLRKKKEFAGGAMVVR